jgi:hypothetical protein
VLARWIFYAGPHTASCVGVRWYLVEKRGHVYLVRKTCLSGKCRQEWIGNVDVIEQVMRGLKARGPRPYYRPCSEDQDSSGVIGAGAPMVRPPGFEPGIAGLGGRRPSPG